MTNHSLPANAASQHHRLIPRDYQVTASKDGAAALNRKGDTLHVIPTGGGKTVTGLLTATEAGFTRTLILVHRDELVSQWLSAAALVMPDRAVSTVTAAAKDWSGAVVISMVPTLARNLDAMPAAFDLVMIDEAHHAPAPSWQAILETARRRRPDARTYGCTATPERGDGKGLRRVFSNVSFALPLRQLVEEGHLVEPRAYAFDIVQAEELDRATRGASDFGDQDGVAAVLNTPEANGRAVELWKEKAGDRRTIAFASNVAHAMALEAAWKGAGITAETLTGETPTRERKGILNRLKTGETQVVTNCAVLTEGFDEPLVGCAVLARGCSHKSLVIQMAGRALRTVDAAKYPGIVKTDAVIIDFGRSLARHGDLMAGQRLDDRPAGEAPVKTCPECEAEVPMAVSACPLCGYEFPTRAAIEADEAKKDAAKRAKLIEIDVLNRSPFAWEPIDDTALVAVGFKASAAVRRWGDGWIAIGLPKDGRAVPLRLGHRYQAMAAADDFMRQSEDSGTAHKTAGWLVMPPSHKQVELLAGIGVSPVGLSRYAASARLTWKWNERRIKAASLQAIGR
jgi:superfamily II DNA or RNA helicase